MQKSQGFSWIRIDKYEFFKRQRPEPDVIEPVPERRLFVLQPLLDLIQNNQHRVDRRIETVCYTVLYRAFRRQKVSVQVGFHNSVFGAFFSRTISFQ